MVVFLATSAFVLVLSGALIVALRQCCCPEQRQSPIFEQEFGTFLVDPSPDLSKSPQDPPQISTTATDIDDGIEMQEAIRSSLSPRQALIMPAAQQVRHEFDTDIDADTEARPTKKMLRVTFSDQSGVKKAGTPKAGEAATIEGFAAARSTATQPTAVAVTTKPTGFWCSLGNWLAGNSRSVSIARVRTISGLTTKRPVSITRVHVTCRTQS